ncbi:MAG: helix-turn-helix domain-containing protein [Phycisphaerales bacterium]
MATKAQHNRGYRRLPDLLRQLREEAEMTQRDLGAKLRRPQSWIYNCETGNRRVDLSEFCDWCKACGVEVIDGVERFLAART